MCNFCEYNQNEIQDFENWANGNESDYEGVDFMLYPNGKFTIAASFDCGYVGDDLSLNFTYCPMCGRHLL